MPRIRNIKPSFYTDGTIVALPPLARLAFTGLWCHADRAGRMEDRPVDLKIRILPADNVDMGKILQQLEEAGLIVRYEAPLSIREGDTGRFIQIVNFEKHQRPHQGELPSALPPPQGVLKAHRRSPDVVLKRSETETETETETENYLGQRKTLTVWGDLFERFWAKYPRKVAKKAAVKAWTKMAPKSEDRMIPLAQGVANVLSDRIRKDWRGRDLDKIPHASTFLHAEEFEEVRCE